MTIHDLEQRFGVTREPMIVFRTITGRIAVQSATLKPKGDNKAKDKSLPPGATKLATCHGVCRRDALRAAKLKFTN